MGKKENKLEQQLRTKLMESDWFKTRPLEIQVVILNYPPYYFYKDQVGYKVRLYSYVEGEDGKCRSVSYSVYPKDNPTPDPRLKYKLEPNGRIVFGARPDELWRLELIPEYDL